MAGAVMRASLAQLASMTGPDGQTIVVPLFEGQQFNTTGAGTTLVDVTNDLVANMGPYVASVQAYTATENKSAQFQWKLQGQGSTTGRTYNTLFDLFANITANGEAPQTAYTAVDNLGRKTRYGLACSAVSGTAVESAVLWCYLAFRLRR